MTVSDAPARPGERLFLVLALTLVATVGTLEILYGQKFAGHGIGKGDPRFYSWMAEDFRGVVLGERLDSYRLQRVLPSSIVSAALTLLGLPKSLDVIARAFAIGNLVLLLATVALWHAIARSLALSVAGRWLGLLLLFGNFACVRAAYYNPVQTDCWALALGALLVYGYVRSAARPLLVGAAAGAFTWPALPWLGALLYLFPRASISDSRTSARGWLVASIVGVLYLAGLASVLLSPGLDRALALPGGTDQLALHAEWLTLSVPLVVAYVVGGFGPLLAPEQLYRPREYRQLLTWTRWVPLLVIAAATIAFVRSLSSGGPPPTSSLAIIGKLVREPVMRPGQSLVAHAVYLGLLPLLLLVLWPRACRAAHELGIGMTLLTASTVALGLSCESRLLMHAVVPLVLLAVMAVEDLRFPRWAPWVLTGLALFGSKLWFEVNREGFLSRDPILSYPAQYWWMNLGPWMSDEMYAVQGSLALAALLVVLLVVRGSRQLSPAEQMVPWPSNRSVVAFPLAAACLALLVALLELPPRVYLAHEAAAARQDAWSRADPVLGWRNIPGAEGRAPGDAGHVLRINSRGVRGPERGYEKAAGVERVVLLGGSVAEAYNVGEEATLRARLEAGLRGSGCETAEVVNLGVARYGTRQQVSWLESEGLRYRPDAVVLLFSHQDIAETLRQASIQDEDTDEPAPTAVLPPHLRQPWVITHRFHRSAALRLLSNFTLESAPALHRALGGIGVVDYGPPPRELWPYGPRDEAAVAWQATRELIERLDAGVRQQGARLLILYVPARFELDTEAWEEMLARYRMSPRFWKPDRVRNRLGALASELDVPLLDPSQDLRPLPPGPAALQRQGLWTDAAHAAVARMLTPPLTATLGCTGAGKPEPAPRARASSIPPQP